MINENIIEKYQEELEEDTKLNMLNLKDAQMMLPSIKHKWAARAIHNKIQLKRYEALQKKARDKELDKLTKNPSVGVSKAALMNKIDESPLLVKITDNISERRLMADYLDKVEKILSSMTYDIRNLTDIMKLETL